MLFSPRRRKTDGHARAGNHQWLLHDKLAKLVQILIACRISNRHAKRAGLELIDTRLDCIHALSNGLIVDKPDAVLGLSLQDPNQIALPHWGERMVFHT